MDEIDAAADGNDFYGLVTDVEVKNCVNRRDHVSEWRRRLDDGVIAIVVKTGKAGGDVHGCRIRTEVDKLNLRVFAHPNPVPVRHNELGLGIDTRIQRIFQAEGRIPDREDPVFFFFNVAQEFSFDVRDPANKISSWLFEALTGTLAESTTKTANNSIRIGYRKVFPIVVSLVDSWGDEARSRPSRL